MKLRQEASTKQEQKQSQRLWLTKSIHQTNNFDIDTYVEALDIPDKECHETVAWMCRQVSKPVDNPLKVLIIGPGAGRVELPFIDALAEKYSEGVNVTFVDYGGRSISKLQDELGKRDYEPAGTDLVEWSKQEISCKVIKADFEDWSNPYSNILSKVSENDRWDVIVAFFVINFFENWITGLKRILSLLTPDGTFFFSEDTDDIRFLDNTFAPIDKDKDLQDFLKKSDSEIDTPDRATFYRFWREYYRRRDEHGHAWQPLISPSDMKVVKDVLVKLGSLGWGKYSGEFSASWYSGKLNFKKWLEIIESSEVFNCLSIIPATLRKTLSREVKSWLNNKYKSSKNGGQGSTSNRRLLKNPIEIRVGHCIYAYKAPGPDKLVNYLDAVNYVVESEYEKTLFKALAFRNPYSLDLSSDKTKIRDHISRVISTKNQLPLRARAAFSVVSWMLDDLADPRKGRWSKEVPILFPEQYSRNDDLSFCISYALYMCKRNYEGTQRKNLPLISDILIHKLPTNLLFDFQVSKEQDTRPWVHFHKTGMPDRLIVGLDEAEVERIRSRARNIIEVIFNKYESDILSRLKPGEQFDFDRLPLVSFEDVLKVTKLIWDDSTIRQEVISLFELVDECAVSLKPHVADALNSIALQKDRWEIDSFNSVVESLASIAYANTVIGASAEYPWTVASFMPAKSILQSIKNNNPWEVGLLGFICYYRPDNEVIFGAEDQREFKESGYLDLMRDLICINVNLFGLQDAIHQYGKLVRRETSRSATAAIMSRNMSHNIGSHVLASSDLMKGVHKDEVQKLHNFLQQRMDFIAQVVTYTPSWGEPTFFFKDLLQGFFDQYLLLGHLIKDQGYDVVRFLVHVGGEEPLVFEKVEVDKCREERCGKLRWASSEKDICKAHSIWGKIGRWMLIPTFRYKDVKDASAIASKLLAPDDPLADQLRKLISEEVLSNLHTVEEYLPASTQLRNVVVRALNELLIIKTLYANRAFSDLDLSEEMKKSAALAPQGEGAIQLNRQILEEAFSDWIVKSTAKTYRISDFIIAMPGGAIGAHAFYDILENIMRNSAKYGKKQKAFEMHLEVKEDKGERYIIKVWDNASDSELVGADEWETLELQKKHSSKDDCKCRICRVQSKLEEPLIDPATGMVKVQSRGVHEMKECARLLAFPFSKEQDEENNERRTWDIRGTRSRRKGEGNKDKRAFQLWAETDIKKEYLVHKLYLQKPRLLGIATPYAEHSSATRIDSSAGKFGVFRYSELMGLMEHSHQFGLIVLPDDKEKWREIIQGIENSHQVVPSIANSHQLLPYRLMLISKDKAACDELLKQSSLPAGRAYSYDVTELPIPAKGKQQIWENFIISVYEKWIESFKGVTSQSKRQVVIAFDRSEAHQAFDAWRSSLSNYKSSLVDVHVIRVWEDSSSESVWNYDVKVSTSDIEKERLSNDLKSHPERYLFWDNHGAGTGALDAPRHLIGFYQSFGSESLKLHHALESPPQAGFGFDFFILGLVESALIKVILIDERVAESVFSQEKFLNTKIPSGTWSAISAFVAAGCYPLFKIHTKCNDVERGTFISDALEENNNIAIKTRPKRAIRAEEGLDLLTDSDTPIKFSTYDPSDGSDIKPLDRVDFVVIHQGVIDRLSNKGCWRGDADINQIYKFSPSVIVTSGRGRTLRQVSQTIPFIEFATVRENTYAGLSKYHLVRALLSVVGNEEGE